MYRSQELTKMRGFDLLCEAIEMRENDNNSQSASNQPQPSMSRLRPNNDAAAVFDVDLTLLSNFHTRQGRERAAYICYLYRNCKFNLLNIKYRNNKDQVFAKLNELVRTKSNKQIEKYYKGLYEEMLKYIESFAPGGSREGENGWNNTWPV